MIITFPPFMMAVTVDLHTTALRDTSSLPHIYNKKQQHSKEEEEEEQQGVHVTNTTTLHRSRVHSHPNTNNDSLLPHHSTQEQGKEEEEEDFVAELATQMTHYSMLQQHDHHHDKGFASLNLSRDSMGSPQSTLWSPLGSNLGSPEGSSSSQELPSPRNGGDSCWKTACDVAGMFERMRLDRDRDNSKYNHHANYGTNSQILKASNVVGLCSNQSLIQQQVRAIQLSRLKEEEFLSLKKKLVAYNNREEYYEGKEQNNMKQFQKKRGFGNGSRNRLVQPPPPPPPPPPRLLGGFGSRGASCGGTGVFLPRDRATASSFEPRKRPGKGGSRCNNILIPARVVQALQLHFHHMAATSPLTFPPLHDVLVSNRDGMYSLNKRQSRKPPADIQNDMILPQEWTY